MRNKLILIFIIFFYLCTRLYKIGNLPESVYWDEASIGYNAFSIANDLKDEWGETLPLHFRAFGEFKLPVYIYSVVPFVKIFGLNAMSVRIPAVLYGIGSLITIYFLAKKISGKETVGLLSAFIFSISPWTFIFSRTGYEAMAGLFFVLTGTYLALSLKEKKTNYLLGVIAFILAFYSYNSFRIIGPMLLIVLTIFVFDKKKISIIALSICVFTAALIPLYKLYKFDTGASRFNQVGISDAKLVVQNYFSNFSPKFLFESGDVNLRSQIPNHGELYYLDVPFIILGLIFIVANKKRIGYLPILMLLIAPIPAALTKESPHALRAILAAPAFAMISAFGINYVSDKIKKYHNSIVASAVILYLLFFENYFGAFITKYQNASASDWQYEYKQIFINKKSGVVTDKYAQPYIFALFYQQILPSEFRSTVKYNPPDKWGVSLVSSFNGYEFR